MENEREKKALESPHGFISRTRKLVICRLPKTQSFIVNMVAESLENPGKDNAVFHSRTFSHREIQLFMIHCSEFAWNFVIESAWGLRLLTTGLDIITEKEKKLSNHLAQQLYWKHKNSLNIIMDYNHCPWSVLFISLFLVLYFSFETNNHTRPWDNWWITWLRKHACGYVVFFVPISTITHHTEDKFTSRSL